MSFTVSDNGCTDESYFDVDVRKSGDDEFEVGIRRDRQDYCKALNPIGTTVSWTYKELGIPYDADVTILNRVRRN